MRLTKSRALGRMRSIDFTVAVIISIAATFYISSAAHAQRGVTTLPRNLADLSTSAGQTYRSLPPVVCANRVESFNVSKF